ncbi:hypothetical protein HanRHA438_Chr09g0415191 [Helianthus annuus]|uniref:Uncharacterized protein n=1 Tax=Helianthus annuus TaxID=4232 RepID=A0A251TY49_HELAN|nr:uncharacterized protein LOC110879376 [Helianthus annuus]KAF5792193.1 hypothetical protein HanXRQr2_Chr09g0403311 [Helianthus annuus]KAJ0527162.1 hypothetical protein HanHA300_Chr09g0331091 [Helianthus annuus]KAJ0543563.1 hypothetical protein HanHA89_Chr09g0352061 [Helianthus annuus]KAJ0708617.1 hypothetical protein HanLR1_Chr09g0331371 [Helianthus annuus]KAJ0889650.1 hypothetical protein HanRHA438_Chr09g0415191 [Helianthus annuus]
MQVQSSSKVSKKSSKRFLFDKRYGYVYDDWIEPSEVALAYGRGMFCIVPLGKALFTMVSESVNLAARRTIEVLERPDQLSSRSLQKVDDLNNQLHQVMFSMKNMQSNHFKVNQVSYQRP